MISETQSNFIQEFYPIRYNSKVLKMKKVGIYSGKLTLIS